MAEALIISSMRHACIVPEGDPGGFGYARSMPTLMRRADPPEASAACPSKTIYGEFTVPSPGTRFLAADSLNGLLGATIRLPKFCRRTPESCLLRGAVLTFSLAEFCVCY